ncbi:hypothetical protein [Paenibacillus zanthoxyli]|uniref:hypothetical protein n=1 Tax=Paenibacillus zanthoxyli TaxID=369399 RepID=UPI00046F42A6|nr:hypothetical protein [Paenibacillus zanthoxyli]
MARIIRFKTPKDKLIDALEYILEQAKEGNLVNFAFASQLTDGAVATSYFNCDFSDKNVLVGHMQADIMYGVVKANIDQLIEYI